MMHIQSLQWLFELQASNSAGFLDYLRFAFNLPGNLVVELIGLSPTLSSFLGIAASPETGYSSLNGLLTKILSCAFWLFLFIQALNFSSQPKDSSVYLDEDSKTQPLLLPLPKDYPMRSRHL